MRVFIKYSPTMKIVDLKHQASWQSTETGPFESLVRDNIPFGGPPGTYSSFNMYFGGIGLNNDWEVAACGIAPGDVLTLSLEQSMALELHDHRGHVCDPRDLQLRSGGSRSCHPDNLLDVNERGSTREYCSTRCDPFEDWIIFESPNTIDPRRIMLRNSDGCPAIKSMCVSWSDNGKEWKELIQINDIAEEARWRQWFTVNDDEANDAKNRMQFVKIHKIDNGMNQTHCNVMREFGVFGMVTRWNVLATGLCREMGVQTITAIPDDVVQIILRYLPDCEAETQLKLKRARKLDANELESEQMIARHNRDMKMYYGI